MIVFLGLVWRRLTVGPCEDVGTLLDEWSDERARKAAATTAKLDQGLTLSSYGPAVTLDAEAGAAFMRERWIADAVRRAAEEHAADAAAFDRLMAAEGQS